MRPGPGDTPPAGHAPARRAGAVVRWAFAGAGRLAAQADAWLLGLPRGARIGAITLTVAVLSGVALTNVPEPYVDYDEIPVLDPIEQYDSFGPDTISDEYGAKVVLNDLDDMYTRDELEQTPLERATWSKEESAPYLPAVLLAMAGLYVVGDWTDLEYYGVISLLAVSFLGLSLRYFLRTRWYLFPVLYLNSSYVGYRFFHVQDGSYLIMLVVVMAALLVARHREAASQLLMALAITLKALPLYFAKNVFRMSRPVAAAFLAVLAAGLIWPYFIWEDYLYIYGFHAGLKGNLYDAAAALVVAVPFAICLWYVEARLNFDAEDRLGWSLVPFAMFLGLRMRVTRHLLIALLVPDKRGPRNVIAATGLALHALLPQIVEFGSVLYIMTGLLILYLAYFLNRIGWDTVAEDLRQPRRTVEILMGIRPAA